jgi:ABC-type nickel/cobalt efflux system permease component RcnA
MWLDVTPGLLTGAVALGVVHGVEPGHGWPVAASYALDRSHKWLYGFAASLVIGVGHLVSSIAMVLAFFYAKSYFDLAQVNEPLTVGGLEVGGPVSFVAGVLLIVLGVREYRHGHDHSHGEDGHGDGHDHGGDHSHGHDHGGGGHAHDHSHGDAHARHDHAGAHTGPLARVRGALPFVGGDDGGHSHGHDHGDATEAADRGMLGIAWFAFVLGFAHEEEFEIIALCTGSSYCLELMLAYALTVVAGIVGLTLLLIAGYKHFEERVERYTPYLPLFSAVVLVGMGIGFVLGLF